MKYNKYGKVSQSLNSVNFHRAKHPDQGKQNN